MLIRKSKLNVIVMMIYFTLFLAGPALGQCDMTSGHLMESDMQNHDMQNMNSTSSDLKDLVSQVKKLLDKNDQMVERINNQLQDHEIIQLRITKEVLNIAIGIKQMGNEIKSLSEQINAIMRADPKMLEDEDMQEQVKELVDYMSDMLKLYKNMLEGIDGIQKTAQKKR